MNVLFICDFSMFHILSERSLIIIKCKIYSGVAHEQYILNGLKAQIWWAFFRRVFVYERERELALLYAGIQQLCKDIS